MYRVKMLGQDIAGKRTVRVGIQATVESSCEGGTGAACLKRKEDSCGLNIEINPKRKFCFDGSG